MIIVIGTDHRGFTHKNFIMTRTVFASTAVEWLNVGADSAERSDYPEFAIKACTALQHKKAERGVLLCGSGVGMSVAANRFQGIYAALAWNADIARQSAQEDKANVLVLPADCLTPEECVSMIEVWLSCPFKGGRYEQRIEQVDRIGGVTV